jgi:hypothetical protein
MKSFFRLPPVARPLFVAAIVLSSFTSGCKQDPPKPGQEAFEAANASITVFDGKAGFGNTPDAEKVAARYAVEISKRETEAFEGGKDADKSLTTQGKWLTHCQDDGGSVVFLVHVPHLDTYEGEAREALASLAWETAVELSHPLRSSADKSVKVALRGNLLFGAFAEGKATGKPTVQTGPALEAASLYPHFSNPS